MQGSSHRRAFARALLMLAVLAGGARAQRVDSAGVAARIPKRDTTAIAALQPPLSPRRAFLYSLAIPGLAQSKLGRPVGGAIFVFTESIAIAMLREAAADLRQAKRFRTDSLVFVGRDPVSGDSVLHRSAFTDDLIKVRNGHVEDWIAFLIANHLFAGADAYVAAHLWDLPAQINLSQTPTGTVIAARIRW